jgi:uncharacterized protein (TIGR02996 family)
MTDREALLRAVCENPDDDLPRLVFADWLEEHDEPERAEFIRLQIEIASASPSHRGWKRINDRIQQLLQQATWSPRPGRDLDCVWGAYRRGFVEDLWMDDADPLFEEPTAYFDQTPIRVLRFAGRVEIPRLLALPQLHRIRVLEIGLAGILDDELRLLARSSALDRLAELHLWRGSPNELSRRTENLLYERFHDRLNLVNAWEDDH